MPFETSIGVRARARSQDVEARIRSAGGEIRVPAEGRANLAEGRANSGLVTKHFRSEKNMAQDIG